MKSALRTGLRKLLRIVHGARINNESGFSLVELLVASSVFAFGMLGVIGLQMYAIRGGSYSWNSTLAQRLAQQKIEYLESKKYTSAQDAIFGTLESNQNNVPVNDRVTAGGNDTIRVDIEGFGQVKENPATYFGSGVGSAVAPYDRFRRITIQKIVNGALGTDNRMVVKVIVYWVGQDSDPSDPASYRKISMMEMIAL
jgi:prepilin-type N-terminal cleavage/methylation domain-containing protein